MSISFNDVGSVFNDASSGTIDVPKPATLADGAFMVAFLGSIVQTTITPPAGWTLEQTQDAGANTRAWTYSRQVSSTPGSAAAEPATYTWTLGVNTKNHGVILAHSGVDSATPISAKAGGTSAAGTSHASPSVAVTENGWLLTHAAARHATTGVATTWTTSDGLDAERADHGSTAGAQDISGAVYDSNRALAAGSYSRTLTSSQTESQIALQSIALQVASTSPTGAPTGAPTGTPEPAPSTQPPTPGRGRLTLLDEDSTSPFLLPTYAGVRQSTFKFSLVDGVTNEVIAELHPLRDNPPTLTHDTTRTIVRTLSPVILDPDETALIDVIRHRIDLSMVTAGVEYPLGRYMWTDRTDVPMSFGTWSTSPLADEMFLVDQQIERAVNAASIDAMITLTKTPEELIAEVMRAQPVSVVVESGGFYSIGSWAMGTQRAQVLGDIALACGYFAPWFGNDQRLHFVRAFDPAVQIPTFDWDTRDVVIRGSETYANDLLTAPNRFIVVSNNATSDRLLEAIIGIHDIPSSAPHSILNRGYVVPRVDTLEVDSSSQAQLVAENIAQRLTVVERVELSTPPDPRHDSYDVIRWRGVNWLEVSWTLTCTEGAPMRHTLRKAYV